MTKADIAERIHEVTGFSRKESAEYLEEAFAIMKRMLTGGRRLQISGFGTFEVKQKRTRQGRNPHTGEAMTIQARRILTFKASILLRQQLNSHSSEQGDASSRAGGDQAPKIVSAHRPGNERLEQTPSV